MLSNITIRLLEINEQQEERNVEFDNVTARLLEMNKQQKERNVQYENITAHLSEIINEQERQIVSNFEYKVVRHLAVSAKELAY